MWAGRMVTVDREAGTEHWFFDLEAIRVDAKGSVAWHLAAVSARLSDDEKTLLLKGVDLRDPKRGSEAVYFAGTRAVAERNILPGGIAVEDLSYRSLDRTPLAGRGMAELWRIRQTLAPSEAMYAAISVQDGHPGAAAPFTFLVASLFAVAFGWSLRGRWFGRVLALAYLAAPLVVVAAGILTQLYVHAHQVLLGFALTSLSFPVERPSRSARSSWYSSRSPSRCSRASLVHRLMDDARIEAAADQTAAAAARMALEPAEAVAESDEREILRRLAERVAALGRRRDREKRALWSAHNSLGRTRPVIFCDPENGWNEIITARMGCRGKLARPWEMDLRKEIFWGEEMGDDKPVEPFFDVPYTV